MNTIFSVVTDGDAIYLVPGDDFAEPGKAEPIDGFEVKAEMTEFEIKHKIDRMVKAATAEMSVRELFFD